MNPRHLIVGLALTAALLATGCSHSCTRPSATLSSAPPCCGAAAPPCCGGAGPAITDGALPPGAVPAPYGSGFHP